MTSRLSLGWLAACVLVIAGAGLHSAQASTVWPVVSDLGRSLQPPEPEYTKPSPLALFAHAWLTEASMAVVETVDALSKEAPQSSPRELLIDLADTLTDIRYRRGGRDPSTGFDCSGFVRYVFEHSLGLLLPRSSAAQYQTGEKIARSDLRRGDLVFFHIHGKRISHVGIYVADGRFIHAPSAGKRVRTDRLDDAYWARHYAGARRVEMLALLDTGKGLAPPPHAP